MTKCHGLSTIWHDKRQLQYNLLQTTQIGNVVHNKLTVYNDTDPEGYNFVRQGGNGSDVMPRVLLRVQVKGTPEVKRF